MKAMMRSDDLDPDNVVADVVYPMTDEEVSAIPTSIPEEVATTRSKKAKRGRPKFQLPLLKEIVDELEPQTFVEWSRVAMEYRQKSNELSIRTVDSIITYYSRHVMDNKSTTKSSIRTSKRRLGDDDSSKVESDSPNIEISKEPKVQDGSARSGLNDHEASQSNSSIDLTELHFSIPGKSIKDILLDHPAFSEPQVAATTMDISTIQPTKRTKLSDENLSTTSKDHSQTSPLEAEAKSIKPASDGLDRTLLMTMLLFLLSEKDENSNELKNKQENQIMNLMMLHSLKKLILKHKALLETMNEESKDDLE